MTFFSFRWEKQSRRSSRRRVAARGEQLERRLALSISNDTDAQSIAASIDLGHPQSLTCGCPGCALPAPGLLVAPAFQEPPAVAIVPLDQTFSLQSRPEATKSIYLDFNGHTTVGTYWNTLKGVAQIITPPYSIDGDPAFSDTELRTIQNVWARVAELFSPFDVNVTTHEPPAEDLRRFGGSDDRWGIRVVIGPDVANFGGGGFAQLGSFSSSIDVPAFVFSERFGDGLSAPLANAIAHEVGHTLGLVHDGTHTASYYDGHGGTGPTSWAPIMGVGYGRQVVQWSRGEYAGANNFEDDLAIITGSITTPYTPNGNGFGYRDDDHGDTLETATEYLGADLAGVIEQSTDVDLFRFDTFGRIEIDVQPAPLGPMLDVLAEILDANGTVLSTSNPLDSLTASFTIVADPGTYYLRVRGTGVGDPATTGYSTYGSLGQYTVSITVETEPRVPSVVDQVDVAPPSHTPSENLAPSPQAVVPSVVPSLPVSVVAPIVSSPTPSIGSPPSTPDFVRASGVIRRPGATSVVLGWQAPPASGPITQYVIRFRMAGTARWQTLRVSGDSPVAVIPNLAPNKVYEFRVAAINSFGTSQFRSTGLVRLSTLPRL